MRQPPELILTDAQVRTMDPARPFAQALAIAGGRIVAVGLAGDVGALAGPGTRVVRLHGKALMPGLIDSHTHGLWGACRDLFEVFPGLGAPLQAVLDGVAAKAAATPPGAWIIGGPRRPFDRADLGMRPCEILDRIAPDHPVALKDVSQHNLWVNSAAMRLAGIVGTTPEVPGGQIERDAAGQPTGILIETAGSLVQPFLQPTADQLAQAVVHMAGYFHSMGMTGFKEPMAFAAELKAYADADLAGRLRLHVGAHLTRFSPFASDWVPIEDLQALRARYRTQHLDTGFAKLFLDGVPIARTVAFCAPYPGQQPAGHDPDAMLLIAPDRLAEELILLDGAGFTVKMHAVGDRAIQVGLDAIAAARAANGPSGLRHEIAHSNFIRPQDIARFAALDAVPEVSPKLWYPNPVTPGQRQVLGEARAESCHPVRSLLDAGAAVIYGSDWPAAAPDADPWTGLAGMITRTDPTGRHPGSVGADQAIELERALPVFTTNAARALRLDGVTGVLAAGASADLMLLDRPLDGLDAPDLGAIRPLATLFEGEMVFGAL
ncbi:MAG: amidohydrolase [Rhodobacterales bacterium]|nr:amidohydrolase [Rhodobacterales bacterium]MDX5498634.1 amidohydrolase [Rhodobacterales bacterium]